MNDSIELYVQRITRLPTLPVTAQEILKLVSDDMTSTVELEKIIQKDPSISAKILSVANSVFFGTRLPTKTVGNAIIRIGFNNVKNIALGISLLTVFEGGYGKKPFEYEKIFQHCATVGSITKLLCRELGMEDLSEEGMMCGLLHDIGYLVMNRYFPENYMKVIKAIDNNISLLSAEMNEFGFTHADIGTWLADKWNLPDPVLDVTLFHHSPLLAKRNIRHVAVIHIADYIATKDVACVTAVDPQYPYDPFAVEVLGITQNRLDEAVKKVRKDVIT